MHLALHTAHTTITRWNRRVRVALLLPFTALSLSGCATPDAAGPARTLHRTLEAQARRHHVCAVAIAVVRDGRLESTDAASGCSPATAVTAVTADSVFQAASLGKPVFAYAVPELARDGRIDLDAPVMSYLPHRACPACRKDDKVRTLQTIISRPA